MPASGTRYERAATFGALDSTALAEGVSENAFLCREVARNSNRLYSAGGPMLSLQWNSYLVASDGVGGVMADYASFPDWQRLYQTPLVGAHQPQLRTAYVDICANITTGSVFYLQVGTSAVPFRSRARSGAENIFAMTGTGGYSHYSFSGCVLGNTELEYFDVGILAEPDRALASLVGTVTGTVDIIESAYIIDEAATFYWTEFSNNPFRYFLAIFDSSGALLTSPRAIRGARGTGIDIDTRNRFTEYERRVCLDQTYEIWDSAMNYQLASLMITEADDSAV